MSEKKDEFKSNLLISEPPLQVLPSLAIQIGLNEAIVLQQLHYWVKHYRDAESKLPAEKQFHFRPDSHQKYRWWIYNSYTDWRKSNFPFWSAATIRRAFTNLENAGLIIVEQLSADKHDRTNWYAIDYEKLKKLEEGETSTSDDVPANAQTGEQMHSDKMSTWKESKRADGSLQDAQMIKGINTETTPEGEEDNDGCAIGSAAVDGLVIKPDLAEAVSVWESTGRELDSDTLARLEIMAASCAEVAQDAGETGGQWVTFALQTALGKAKPQNILNYSDTVIGSWVERGYRKRRRKHPTTEEISPELDIFRAATGRLPLPDQRDLVISIIHQHQFSSDDLRPFWEAWIGRDKKRSDLTWLTEWAVSGVIPQSSYAQGAKPSAVAAYLKKHTKGN